ncbi:hypothetical protein G5I_03451 [Acromyrmex echinatior]|uniref:Uncharacterized protein n=1 Tax=Acromyrmex echinatior TaxID=103372 RepID=F4WD11_ACREC|nr:hypothetical protein G5I_03451 [Acromyrmex echinatior]
MACECRKCIQRCKANGEIRGKDAGPNTSTNGDWANGFATLPVFSIRRREERKKIDVATHVAYNGIQYESINSKTLADIVIRSIQKRLTKNCGTPCIHITYNFTYKLSQQRHEELIMNESVSIGDRMGEYHEIYIPISIMWFLLQTRMQERTSSTRCKACIAYNNPRSCWFVGLLPTFVVIYVAPIFREASVKGNSIRTGIASKLKFVLFLTAYPYSIHSSNIAVTIVKKAENKKQQPELVSVVNSKKKQKLSTISASSDWLLLFWFLLFCQGLNPS